MYSEPSRTIYMRERRQHFVLRAEALARRSMSNGIEANIKRCYQLNRKHVMRTSIDTFIFKENTHTSLQRIIRGQISRQYAVCVEENKWLYERAPTTTARTRARSRVQAPPIRTAQLYTQSHADSNGSAHHTLTND